MPYASASLDRRAILGLVLAFLVLVPAITARLNASDEIEYFAWLRSWAFDRDVDFENEYRYFHDQAPDKHSGLRQTFLESVNEAGRRPNFTPIGTALLWSPFYLAGHVAAGATGHPRDGFSRPYLVAVTFGSAVYGLLALVLAADFARRALAERAVAAAWITWFGTPLVFYMYVAPGFSHAASAFVVSLFLWIWIRVRRSWTAGGAAVLGACAALLPMIREQDAFFVIGPALDFALWSWRRVTHEAGDGDSPPAVRAVAVPAIAGLLTAAVAYVPQVLAYLALNGHAGPTSTVTRKMSWWSPHFFGVLFSPEHGLFFWTPLVLLALGGLVTVAVSGLELTDHDGQTVDSRPDTIATIATVVLGAQGAVGRRDSFTPDQRWLAGLLALMVLGQTYVSGAVESWTVAGSFGQRRFVAITPIVVTGLAVVFDLAARRPRRTLLAVFVALAIWWNLGLMALFGLHLMDRQRLEIGRNAVAVFWEMPRQMPQVVWRYLTARESLYDLPRRE